MGLPTIYPLLIRDHFSAGAFGQQLAPFSALAAAAAVTGRLPVGTMVLSNDFRHPAIVAHEAASLHHLSGGRFELGIGRWYQPEYSAAGSAFDSPGQRIDRPRSRSPSSADCGPAGPVHHTGSWYQIDGPVASNPSVHQSWPPVRTSVSSTSHRGASLQARGERHHLPSGR